MRRLELRGAEGFQLGEEDIGAALRLVARFAWESGSASERGRSFLARFASLVGADAWVWALQRFYRSERDPVSQVLFDGGWTSRDQRRAWFESSISPEIEPLLLVPAPNEQRHVTIDRSALIGDAEWYASRFYLKHREPAGLDDLLVSALPASACTRKTLHLHRFAGRQPFGRRERTIVHTVIGAVGGQLRADLCANRISSPGAALSRREREVLALLVEGLSTKQVGSKLGLSAHTVRDYTKSLYRRLLVHSRGELLARFIPENGSVIGED